MNLCNFKEFGLSFKMKMSTTQYRNRNIVKSQYIEKRYIENYIDIKEKFNSWINKKETLQKSEKNTEIDYISQIIT